MGTELVQMGGYYGPAGNFNVEIGHHEVSVRVFEHDLRPVVTANPKVTILAGGFSCQT